ncbi:DMT family transporter [Candidatus Fermentibacteria bacterium]|nr:DMT family transporter [Candidatus Fermentibacteria bacterium]
MDATTDARSFRWIYAKLVLTALFWGGTFIAGRVAADDVGPFSGAFLRFAVASVILVLVLAVRERESLRVPLGELPRLILLGLFGTVLYNVFFFKGLQTVSAGRASIIVALNPALIALCSAIFLRERMTGSRVLGVVLSLSGAMTVISRGDFLTLLGGGVAAGDLCVLGCVGSWVAFTMIGRKTMDRLTPLAMVTWSAVVGTAGLAVMAFREGLATHVGHYPVEVWLGTAYLAVFGTVLGFVWFYQGVKALGPTRAGVFINFVPASSVFLGILLLGEKPTSSLVGGLLLVTAGVYLSNRRGHVPTQAG